MLTEMKVQPTGTLTTPGSLTMNMIQQIESEAIGKIIEKQLQAL